MLDRFVAILLLAVSVNVLADARSGDFMGYQLASKYPRGPATRHRETTTGNLVIFAEQPVKPGDIAEVTVLTTPETLTIGNVTASQWFPSKEEARAFGRRYFELLRAKYPDWAYGGEILDAHMDIVEVNFHKPPYEIRLWVTEDMQNGKKTWRFSMSLGWSPESSQALAWRNLAADEQVAASRGSAQQLLKESDLRGL